MKKSNKTTACFSAFNTQEVKTVIFEAQTDTDLPAFHQWEGEKGYHFVMQETECDLPAFHQWEAENGFHFVMQETEVEITPFQAVTLQTKTKELDFEIWSLTALLVGFGLIFVSGMIYLACIW